MRSMRAAAGLAVLFALWLRAGPVLADEQTVMLAVDGMTCASCPYIVKRTLASVPGVSDVMVSFEKKTATVTYDDTKTSVGALTRATADVGFPSKQLPAGG